MNEPDVETYSLKSAEVAEVAAPTVAYEPPMPTNYRPRIALVGAGGISAAHLEVYREAGLDIAVIANRTLSKAEARRDQYYPDAEATDDIAGTLTRDDIEVVDLTPHPPERYGMMETAINAGKHVLSQKPFVLDLDAGARLCDLADAKGVVLAVNQNGRWAPHLAWMREAVRQGLIGDLETCHQAVHWNHGWIEGTAFEEIDDLILYDFAIHRFDFLTSLIGGRATEVYAKSARAAGQTARPPMLAQAMVAFEDGQGSLVFDADARFGSLDRTVITGTAGTLASDGPDLGEQAVTLTTAAGRARAPLQGTWFKEGFLGTMGALLKAAEDGGTPLHNGRDNLAGLALSFAAVASAQRGVPVAPGAIRSLDEARG